MNKKNALGQRAIDKVIRFYCLGNIQITLRDKTTSKQSKEYCLHVIKTQ